MKETSNQSITNTMVHLITKDHPKLKQLN